MSEAPVVATGRVWPAIAQAMATSGSRRIAVPYVGSSALDLLGIQKARKGDLLICDAEDGTLASGSTDPRGLQALLDAGFRMASVQDLHAKVYATSGTAVVTSANLSATAASNQEAAATLHDREAVRLLRNFVETLFQSGTLIDQQFIDRAREHWQPAPSGAPSRGALNGATRLRIIPIDGEPPAKVQASADTQLAQQPSEFSPARFIDWSAGARGDFKTGDVVLFIDQDDSDDPHDWLVHAPMQYRGESPARVTDRDGDWYIHWFTAHDVDPLPWSTVTQRVLQASGHTLKLHASTRKQVVIETLEELFGITPEPAISSFDELVTAFSVSTLDEIADAIDEAVQSDFDVQLVALHREDHTDGIEVIVGNRAVTIDFPTSRSEILQYASEFDLSQWYPLWWADAEEDIAEVEGLRVSIDGTPDDDNWGALPAPNRYPYQRAAPGNWTVSRWIESRFNASHLGWTGIVLDGEGRAVAGNCLLATARGRA